MERSKNLQDAAPAGSSAGPAKAEPDALSASGPLERSKSPAKSPSASSGAAAAEGAPSQATKAGPSGKPSESQPSRRPLPGQHEHRPSRLAPAEEQERINEENRRLEAKRQAEAAARSEQDARDDAIRRQEDEERRRRQAEEERQRRQAEGEQDDLAVPRPLVAAQTQPVAGEQRRNSRELPSLSSERMAPVSRAMNSADDEPQDSDTMPPTKRRSGRPGLSRTITITEGPESLSPEQCRLPWTPHLAVGPDAGGAMHSSLAGDIHVPLARTLSRPAGPRPDGPPLDTADKALLEHLEEGTGSDGGGDGGETRRLQKRESEDVFNDDGGDLPGRKLPSFWRRRHFREVYVPVIACGALLGAAIALRVWAQHMVVVHFAAWRWLFFFAFTVPIFLICRGCMKCIVLLLENCFFDTKQTLYYLIGIKAWFERCMRMGLITVLFAAIFQGVAHAQAAGGAGFYTTLLRLFCCCTLFAFGMILKTLAAKMLSSHFNKSSYFDKMQDALRKEYYLVALSQPRAERLAELEAEAHGKGLAAKMITPFRFVGSTAMMKRLRVSSSPYLHDDGSASSRASSHASGTAGKPRGKAHLQPLLPVTADARIAASPSSKPPQPPAVAMKPALPPPPSTQPTSGSVLPKSLTTQVSIAEEDEGEAEELLSSRAASNEAAAAVQQPSAATEDVESGRMPRPRKRSPFKSKLLRPQHPVVAYLSHLREPKPRGEDGGGGRGRGGQLRRRMSLLPGGLVGRAERGASRGASIQTSVMSETQRSLASLESMMSGASRPVRLSQMQRGSAAPDRFLEENAALATEERQGDAAFLERLQRIEEHIRNNKLRVNLTDKIGAAAREKEDISNINEAKKLAFYIFWNVKASHDVGYVAQEDLELFLSKERAKQCFESLDCDSNGKLSLQELRDAVVKIYEGRRNLAATLTDTKNVVENLERVMTGVVQFAFFFAYLAIWKVNLQRLWVTLGSMIVSLTFVFGNNMRSIYEAVVYLFVVHPYDVGDAVLVGPNQDWCNVDEIALQTTTFVKWDGSRIVLPNSYLFANMLTNMTRSKEKAETFKFLVDIGTSAAVLDRTEEVVKGVALAYPKDYKPTVSVHALAASDKDPMKFCIQVYWCFVYNATNGRLMPARTKMIMAISNMLRREGILYTMPPIAKTEGPPAESEAVDRSAGDMGLVTQMGVYNMMPNVTSLTVT